MANSRAAAQEEKQKVREATWEAQAKINHLIELCREQPYLNSTLTVCQIYEALGQEALEPKQRDLAAAQERIKELESHLADIRAENKRLRYIAGEEDDPALKPLSHSDLLKLVRGENLNEGGK